MDLTVLRFSDDGDSTLGLLFIDGAFECFTIEDEERKIKVSGETRIPEGSYQIKFREVLSPLTQTYRRRYPSWFTYHLELQDVPDFQHVYMHVGNKESHSDGCLLVGEVASANTGFSEGEVYRSRIAFERIYGIVSDALNNGEQVLIHYKKIEGII